MKEHEHDIYIAGKMDDKIIIGCLFCPFELKLPWSDFRFQFLTHLEDYIEEIFFDPDSYQWRRIQFIDFYLDDIEKHFSINKPTEEKSGGKPNANAGTTVEKGNKKNS